MKKNLLSIVILVAVFSNSFAQNAHQALAAAKSVTGMTSNGGSKGYGVTFRYNGGNGSDSILFDFAGNGNCIFLGNPEGNVIQAKNGRLYGMAPWGGALNGGGIFSYNPKTSIDSVVFSFQPVPPQTGPVGSLVQASNGLLYGMTTWDGTQGNGTIFSYNPGTGAESVLVNFNNTNGANPLGSLMQASNGLLYGMTQFGGTLGDGVLFSLDPTTNKEVVLLNFDSIHGSLPYFTSLIQATNGLLYGMTWAGGDTNSSGVLFSFNITTGKESVLMSFGNAIGSPAGSLMQASNGILYGMTWSGGYSGNSGIGTLFSFNPLTGKDSLLISFNDTNGSNPYGSLIQASNGLLYGMTYSGLPGYGTISIGTIFSYDIKTGKDTVLVKLTGLTDGDSPYGSVMQALDGMLYGMTSGGGPSGGGVLFKLNPVTNKDSILLNFGGGNSGWNENSPLQASNGLLYGLTYSGGTYDYGTLFSYSPVTGKDTILLNFNGTNGSNPYGSLIQASNGLLYGNTVYGGTINEGVFFSYNPKTYKDSILINFNDTNGGWPYSTIVQASNGLIYGMTEIGGKYGSGNLFSYNPITGKNSILYNFSNDSAGNFGPWGPLSQASDGLLYGLAAYGKGVNSGGIFSYNITSGKLDTIYNFGLSGTIGQGNVIVDTAIHTIFANVSGVLGGNGSFFGYNTVTKTATTLINFSGANGSSPTGLLLWDTVSNYIYSTTYGGGTSNYGVLFRYDISTGQDTVLLNFHEDIGANPCGITLSSRAPLGVNAIESKKEVIVVYPNPFRSIATVLFNEEGNHYIELEDLQGNKLRWISTNGKQCNIERNNLTPGMYLVKFYDNNQHYQSTAKIIVQ